MNSRYAVIGNPVAHSKSPEIHAAFANQVGHSLSYERVLSPLDNFADTIFAFREAGGAGCNVTVPFKENAFKLATRHTERAVLAGAANVLHFDAGIILGDNTDGIGLVRDIEQNLGFTIAEKRVLLLGAGGAARGAVGEILRARPAELAIHNRTFSRAEAVADSFRKSCVNVVPVFALTSNELIGRQFDLIINATSASLHGLSLDLPGSIFAQDSLAYDMVYGKGQTPFLKMADQAGAAWADGTGMLVEQAAEAFFIWRGVRPETAPVIASLKK